MVFIQPGPIAVPVFSCTGKPRVVQGGFIMYPTKAKEGDTMEQKLRIPEGDGKRLLIALRIDLINCLPQIIDYVHDTTSRMMDDGYSLDIRLGAFSLKFGRID
jgi:hypothetical protein